MEAQVYYTHINRSASLPLFNIRPLITRNKSNTTVNCRWQILSSVTLTKYNIIQLYQHRELSVPYDSYPKKLAKPVTV